jgi:hypothetical protein
MVVKSYMKSWKEGEYEEKGKQQKNEIYKHDKKHHDENPPTTEPSRPRENPKKRSTKPRNQMGTDEDKRMHKRKPGTASNEGARATHRHKTVIDTESSTPETKRETTSTDDEKRIVDTATPTHEESLENSIEPLTESPIITLIINRRRLIRSYKDIK